MSSKFRVVVVGSVDVVQEVSGGERGGVGLDVEGVTVPNVKYMCYVSPGDYDQLSSIVINNILRGRPALLQLATLSGHVLLIRLCHYETLPQKLQQFLRSPVHIKVCCCGCHFFWGGGGSH